MRRTLMSLFVIGLVASSQGCCKTLRHTAGVCDCYAPPVETLLQAPCPTYHHNGHPVVGAYAPAPYAPQGANNPTTLHVAPVPAVTNVPPASATTTVAPTPTPAPKDVAAKPAPTPSDAPAEAGKSGESIRVLPKLEEK